MLMNIRILKTQIKRILKDHCKGITITDNQAAYLSDQSIDSIAQELIEHEKEILEIKIREEHGE